MKLKSRKVLEETPKDIEEPVEKPETCEETTEEVEEPKKNQKCLMNQRKLKNP